MNQMKCHNCHGLGHRSANCPFSPTHRRCNSCGKAGGLFEHRKECPDGWYDLSTPVPRDPCGKRYSRERTLQLIAAEYEAEKAAYGEAMRRAAARPIRSPQMVNRPKRGCSSTSRAPTALQDSKPPSKSNMMHEPKEKRPNNYAHKSSTIQTRTEKVPSTPSTVGEVSSAENCEGVNTAESQNTAPQVYAFVQDVRVLDGIMTPDGKPIRKTEDDNESALVDVQLPNESVELKEEPAPNNEGDDGNVLLVDSERTFYQRSATGFGIRLNEADAHPSVDAPDVLLRFVFRKAPRIFIDSGMDSSFELTATTLRMSNGLRVKYNGVFLDICGKPTREAVFNVMAPHGTFRLVIRTACVEVNEIFYFSEFGMACLARAPMMLPLTPQLVVTLVGEAEDEIRVRYMGNRYVLTMENGAVRISPFISRDR